MRSSLNAWGSAMPRSVVAPDSARAAAPAPACQEAYLRPAVVRQRADRHGPDLHACVHHVHEFGGVEELHHDAVVRLHPEPGHIVCDMAGEHVRLAERGLAPLAWQRPFNTWWKRPPVSTKRCGSAWSSLLTPSSMESTRWQCSRPAACSDPGSRSGFPGWSLNDLRAGRLVPPLDVWDSHR